MQHINFRQNIIDNCETLSASASALSSSTWASWRGKWRCRAIFLRPVAAEIALASFQRSGFTFTCGLNSSQKSQSPYYQSQDSLVSFGRNLVGGWVGAITEEQGWANCQKRFKRQRYHWRDGNWRFLTLIQTQKQGNYLFWIGNKYISVFTTTT